MATQSIVLTATDAAWAWSTIAPQTVLTAQAIGGGGGGGGETGDPAAAGGGMGGGYATEEITKGAETTLNIVVGIAGTAGAGGNGGAGAASSITQVSTGVLLAPGGGGGAGATSANHSGAGGTVANGVPYGSATKAGGVGGNGVYTTATSGGGGGAAGPTADGGAASGATAGAHGGGNFLNGVDYCSLGAAGRVTTENDGITGPGVGAGGSGGNAPDNTNHPGGAGYRGVVVLTWTLPDLSIKQSECGPEDLSVSMVEVVGSDVRFG